MRQCDSLFELYDYEMYENNFILWRKETINKIEQLDEENLYFLEDQILRQKGFDARKFSNNPITGKFTDFLYELLAPFLEKPYRNAFYTQLETITKNAIENINKD